MALAIAVGVFAVGVVLNAREILVREYRRDRASALVASAVVYTAPFEEDFAESVSRLPLVAAAEGRTLVHGRVYRDGAAAGRGADRGPGLRRHGGGLDLPLTGTYPPARGEVVLERLSSPAWARSSARKSVLSQQRRNQDAEGRRQRPRPRPVRPAAIRHVRWLRDHGNAAGLGYGRPSPSFASA